MNWFIPFLFDEQTFTVFICNDLMINNKCLLFSDVVHLMLLDDLSDDIFILQQIDQNGVCSSIKPSKLVEEIPMWILIQKGQITKYYKKFEEVAKDAAALQQEFEVGYFDDPNIISFCPVFSSDFEDRIKRAEAGESINFEFIEHLNCKGIR